MPLNQITPLVGIPLSQIWGPLVLVAAAAGHFMQFGGAIAERISLANPQNEVMSSEPVQDEMIAALPTPPIEMIMPGDLSQQGAAAVSRVAAVNFAIDTSLQTDAPTPSLFQTSCNVNLTALPEPGAMVRLQLNTPCYGNQRIMVEHAGLEFADVIGADARTQLMFRRFTNFGNSWSRSRTEKRWTPRHCH